MNWPWMSKSEVLDRLKSLESDHRRLKLEWEETLEKLTRAAWRAAKTKAPPAPVLDAPEPQEPAAPHGPQSQGPDPISARILARRGRRLTILGGDS